MDKETNKFLYFGAILGVAIILAAMVMGYSSYKVKTMDNALSVTGSAKQKVSADIVKWTSVFSRVVPIDGLSLGYAQMKDDQATVNSFLLSAGIKAAEINISPVFVEEPFKYDANAPRQYTLRQTIEVQSAVIQKVTDLAKNVQNLANQGVVFSTQSLEYYYSKLPELRVELLSEAVRDAKARAEKIAESTGKKVGVLKSATMGVVQVLPVNSMEVSDYGSYDTSSIDKEVMVTVKTLFNLK